MSAHSAETIEQASNALDAPAKLELSGVGKEFRTKRASTHALSDINLTIGTASSSP